MNRLAIGYSPEELDRATVVFFETGEGVVMQTRGAPAPRVIDQPLEGSLEPGTPQFFDAVLDSFSTSCLIRNVLELEPAVVLPMLVNDQIWDTLPRPRVPA
jgi:hypothetical protein